MSRTIQTVDGAVTYDDGDAGRDEYNPATLHPTVLAPFPSGDDTGVTDRVALQATIDALGSGGSLRLWGGRYHLDQALAIDVPISLKGAGGRLTHYGQTDPGEALTVLDVDSTTSNGLTLTAAGCTLTDLALVNSSATTPTAGSGIDQADGYQLSLERVTVQGFYNLIKIEGTFWSLRDCHLYDPVNYGLWATTDDAALYDHGDFVVSDCHFAMWKQRDATAAMRWEAGGGVRIANTKIVGQQYIDGVSGGGWDYGLDFAAADGVSTVELEWLGGGISSASVAAVRLHQAGTSGTFSRATFTGTVIQGYGATAAAFILGGQDGSSNIGNIGITGNVIAGVRDGIVAHNMTGLTVGPNTWLAVSRDLISLAGSDFGADGADETRSVNVSPQTIGHNGGNLPTDQNLIRDRRVSLGGARHGDGLVDYRYTRQFSCDVVDTWVTVFSFIPPHPTTQSHAAGLVTVDVAAHDSGNAPFGRRHLRSYNVSGAAGTVATATQGTDLAWGYASAHYAFQLDTTTAGMVKVQVKLTTGGTWVSGRMTIDLRGLCYLFGFGTVTA